MTQAGFQFRQFYVRHDRCGMKVGTDGILLGAWADVLDAARILDVGTGSGLIALMLAQRNRHAEITAIELDPAAATQAACNVAESPWPKRIRVVQSSLDSFAAGFDRPAAPFDLVVCNPPFHPSGTQSANPARRLARQGESLTANSLLAASNSLTGETGRLAIIFPADSVNQWIHQAASRGWHPARKTTVFPHRHKPAVRVLVEFVRGAASDMHADELITWESPGRYSRAWCELTNAFYLPTSLARQHAV